MYIVTSCLKYNVLISRKKSLMGIKRHKIHQGSLCSFVLLGRSLPDIDFETKTTPSAFWCKIHDAGSAVSHGDFTRNLVAEMRCSQKKTLLLINGTLTGTHVYTCTLSPWNNILVYIYPICALLIYLNILTRIKTETPSLQCCSPTYK